MKKNKRDHIYKCAKCGREIMFPDAILQYNLCTRCYVNDKERKGCYKVNE